MGQMFTITYSPVFCFDGCLIWCIPMSFRFRSMAPMYYRRANAAVIMYDITREQSFEEAQEWVEGEEWEVSFLSVVVHG